MYVRALCIEREESTPSYPALAVMGQDPARRAIEMKEEDAGYEAGFAHMCRNKRKEKAKSRPTSGELDGQLGYFMVNWREKGLLNMLAS